MVGLRTREITLQDGSQGEDARLRKVGVVAGFAFHDGETEKMAQSGEGRRVLEAEPVPRELREVLFDLLDIGGASQQQALREAGQWGAISAIGPLLADATLRSARSHAEVQVASLTPVPSLAQAGVPGAPVFTRQPDGTGMADEEEGALLEELDAGLLPTDAEELGEGEEPETSITPDDPDAP